mgnify:CR=1 FL=1
MSQRKIILIFVLVALLGVLLWLKFGQDLLLTQHLQLVEQSQTEPHVYQNSKESLKEIDLHIIYVVPVNAVSQINSDWQTEIQTIVPEITKFHNAQFRGSSKLNVKVEPQPLILSHDNLYYDTDNTNNGNPKGLENIYKEVDRRIGSELKGNTKNFVVFSFIYEGVGASGTEGATLLSKSYLDNEEFASIRATLFYHEFGHAMGLLDQYDIATNKPSSGSVMGSGRFKPIDLAYFDSSLLIDLGIAQR